MEKNRSIWMTMAIAGCVVVVLLGAYIGAYSRMVEPLTVTRLTEPPTDVVVPTYSWNKGAINFSSTAASGWDSFFEPIHRLDRRLRPSTWEPVP